MQKNGFDVSAIMGSERLQVWVEFNDQAMVLVNHVSRERFAALIKAATVKKWDRNHQLSEEFDNLKFGELLGIEAVADWTGFVVAGAELPCAPENIAKFMRRWADFAKFISDICTNLERLMDVEKASAVKNSSSTSGPA